MPECEYVLSVLFSEGSCNSLKPTGNAEVFVPGMIVTVEPGIYIPDDPSIPEEYDTIRPIDLW